MIPRSIGERSVFVDTSAFYSAISRTDARHRIAAETFALLQRERLPLFTSNIVVAETHALMLRRLGRTIAARWLSSLDINLVFATELDHDQALDLIRRYTDKDFSYADAVSFVLMGRLGIPTAFAFDADFRVYGFQAMP